ncbi:hypothetical protein DBR42_23300, partial [Pelomonas sp. HMWF004]
MNAVRRSRKQLRPLPSSFVVVAVLAMCGGGFTPAQAQAGDPGVPSSSAEAIEYDLPASTLGATAAAIARISGLEISIDPTVSALQGTSAVRGRMGGREAMNRALKGSGLVTVQQGAILRIETLQKISAVTIIAKRDVAEISFKADRSDTATRSGTDLMNVPMSMTMITSK